MSLLLKEVAHAAEELAKTVDASCEALANGTYTDSHYEIYIHAAESLVNVLVDTEEENTRFLAEILRAVANALESH